MLGAQSFIGMPGKPAPEPRSASSKALTAEGAEYAEATRGNKWRAANRDSPKWRVTISSSLRIAVRLMRAFQCWSISMYVDILWSWVAERTAGSLRLRSGQASPGLRLDSE